MTGSRRRRYSARAPGGPQDRGGAWSAVRMMHKVAPAAAPSMVTSPMITDMVDGSHGTHPRGVSPRVIGDVIP